MNEGRLTTIDAARRFVLGGNATMTLRSARTGQWFTYRVRRDEEDQGLYWVRVLTGPDNEAAYTYLGRFLRGRYYQGRRIGAEAPSARAFQYLARCLDENQLPPSLEVFHEGRCGACGRKLTVPESVATGFGPDCAERLGIPYAREEIKEAA